jgi:hypothetical protein
VVQPQRSSMRTADSAGAPARLAGPRTRQKPGMHVWQWGREPAAEIESCITRKPRRSMSRP